MESLTAKECPGWSQAPRGNQERKKGSRLWVCGRGRKEILGSEATVSSCLAWEQAPPGDQAPERRAAAVAGRGQAGRSPPPASALRLDALS